MMKVISIILIMISGGGIISINAQSPVFLPSLPLPLSTAAVSAVIPEPPRPPMFACADDSGPASKSVNDTCKIDADCNNYAMQCRKGICTCRHNYFPRERKAGGMDCQIAPSLDQPCVEICQKPLVCTFTNLPMSSHSISALPRSAGDGRKRCACLAPAVMKTGICVLECKKDEYYANGECWSRCKVDEIKTDELGCLKRAGLDVPCEYNRQCLAAFSECSGGICKCKSGFSANKGECQTKSYSCPFGDPITSKSGAIKQCKLLESSNTVISVTRHMASDGPEFRGLVSIPPAPSGVPTSPPFAPDEQEDTCGNGEFCLLEGNIPRNDGAVGHCCPKRKPQCPIGSPHPSASCDHKARDNGTRCPHLTHYCLVHEQYSSSVCCPLACSMGSVFVEGHCLPAVHFGDACRTDAQCRTHNGVCHSGVCTCDGNSTAEGDIYKHCRITCSPDQIEHNNRCYPRFKLGDPCQQGSSQCPLNAYCNSKNICACRCGHFAIGDTVCGPQPVCHSSPIGSRPIPFAVKAVSIDPITNPVDRPNSTINGKMKNSFNITYCKISAGAKSPLATAVDQCPSGETCAFYLQNLGICCPTPKPICPLGESMDKKCDPKIGCGKEGFCYRYFTPASATDTSVGFICCPTSLPIPLAIPVG